MQVGVWCDVLKASGLGDIIFHWRFDEQVLKWGRESYSLRFGSSGFQSLAYRLYESDVPKLSNCFGLHGNESRGSLGSICGG